MGLCCCLPKSDVAQEPQLKATQAPKHDKLVNINTASVAQLQTLPGLGPKRSSDIVAYRAKNGPFNDVAALTAVKGIGPAILSQLEDHICCSSSPVPAKPKLQGGQLLPSQPATVKSRCEAFFFPDDREGTQLARLLQVIASAQRSVNVAVYKITHDALANALAVAHQRGVTVRVITDDEQVHGSGSDIERLQSSGIPVRTDASSRNLMHHKFMVVDDILVANGSFNWTGGAANGNNENLILCPDASVIQQFTAEFNRLWADFGAGVESKSASSTSTGKVAVLFFPDDHGTNVDLICRELAAAKHSIDVAVFTLTNDRLVDVLLCQHQRGLCVRIITDLHQAGCSGADAQQLRDTGIGVRMNRSVYKPMHHKFAVIDGKTLINGSFNWTARAAQGNQENAIIWRQAPDLATSFSKEFVSLWSKFAPK